MKMNHEVLRSCSPLSHLDANGHARMVDVGNKAVTKRIAVASGSIKMNAKTLELIVEGRIPKGDVLAVARVAGIMASKQTPMLIPMCHSLMLEQCQVELCADKDLPGIRATCTVCTHNKTGVEMEALTGVTVALLTLYDMCKSFDRGMEIREVHLEEKDGGKSGHYIRKKEE